MARPISPQELQIAAAELSRMRSSLVGWLKYRSLNDRVMAGTARVRKPLGYAQRVVAAGRDRAAEQDLATKLHALLEVVMQGQSLPSDDLNENPLAAVQLAQIALAGGTQVMSPVATGGLLAGSHPWMWPVLIVSGMLIVATTAIKTAADVAKDREEKSCIEAGACTDYGFWIKAGGLLALAWFAWKEMGGRELVHSLGKKGRT